MMKLTFVTIAMFKFCPFETVIINCLVIIRLVHKRIILMVAKKRKIFIYPREGIPIIGAYIQARKITAVIIKSHFRIDEGSPRALMSPLSLSSLSVSTMT